MTAPMTEAILRGLDYFSPITSFAALPTMIADIVTLASEEDILRLKSLDSLIVGGARTSEATFKWMVSRGIPYYDTCGATELVGAFCIRKANDEFQSKHGFELIPGLTGYLIVDDPSDGFGELVVSSKVSFNKFVTVT